MDSAIFFLFLIALFIFGKQNLFKRCIMDQDFYDISGSLMGLVTLTVQNYIWCKVIRFHLTDD